jgi:Family of unknown function (DUF5990)
VFVFDSMKRVQIVIEARDLPGRSCGPSPERPNGHHNVHVGVQRRNRPDDLDGLTPGDAPAARWVLECKATQTTAGLDLTGPFIQGRPGNRFIYLSWGTVDDEGFRMFRRAKLVLDQIPPQVLERAVKHGRLVARLGLTDQRGNPACADQRSGIEWAAP